jgi:amino acid transporter
MIFAFSRDGGLPASGPLSKVSPKYRTPVAAIWTAAALSVIFVWGSSFCFPIALGALAWGTPKWERIGPWDMGHGVFMLFVILSLLSMILIFVIGIQPPNQWALYITVGFFVLTAIVWFALPAC